MVSCTECYRVSAAEEWCRNVGTDLESCDDAFLQFMVGSNFLITFGWNLLDGGFVMLDVH